MQVNKVMIKYDQRGDGAGRRGRGEPLKELVRLVIVRIVNVKPGEADGRRADVASTQKQGKAHRIVKDAVTKYIDNQGRRCTK